MILLFLEHTIAPVIVITSAILITTITPSEAAITVVVLSLADEVIITQNSTLKLYSHLTLALLGVKVSTQT